MSRDSSQKGGTQAGDLLGISHASEVSDCPTVPAVGGTLVRELGDVVDGSNVLRFPAIRVVESTGLAFPDPLPAWSVIQTQVAMASQCQRSLC